MHLIQWGQERPAEEFDADSEEHMMWVYQLAAKRAQQYGIQARTLLSCMQHCCCLCEAGADN